MNKNQVLVINGKEMQFKNEVLQKELLVMQKASIAGSIALWDYAQAVTNIVKGELFTEDFKSLNDFSAMVGLTKGTITKYTKAIEYVEDNNIERANVSLNTIYAIASAENVPQLEEYIETNLHKDPQNASVREIEKAKQMLKAKDQPQAKVNILYKYCLYDGHYYKIPADILKKYAMTEEEEKAYKLRLEKA